MRSDKNKRNFILKLVYYGLFAVVAAVFLWRIGGGEDTLGTAPVFTAQASPAPTLDTRYAKGAEFTRVLETLGAQAAEVADQYLLPVGEGLEPAQLVLSLKDGFVRSFTLRFTPLERPKQPRSDATVIENKSYELKQAYYEAQVAWLEECLPRLTNALDAQQELTYAQVDGFILAAKAALSTGKNDTGKAGSFTFSATFDASAEPAFLHISVSCEKK